MRYLRVKEALDAIADEPRGACFESICIHLALFREPDLIAGPGQNDGGQDAHLPDESLSLGCSLTSTWDKVASDIDRIKARRPNLRTFWFYTYGNPGKRVTDRWIKRAQERFGVTLVVIPGRDILLRLERTESRFICEKYLPGIYPTGTIRLLTRDDILSSLGGWNENSEHATQLLDELLQRAARNPRDSDYTYLAQVYFFLKAGPVYCQRYPEDYQRARNRLHLICSRRDGPWKMPGYWLLARLLLSEVPYSKTRHQAMQLTGQANRLFERIRPCVLPHHILLPGSAQEFPPDLYESLTSDFDPLVDCVVVPDRYLATTRLSLAALRRFSDRSYVHDIGTHLQRSGRLRSEVPRLRLNAMLVSIMTRCISTAMNDLTETASLEHDIEEARDGIKTAYANDELGCDKKLEWLAALGASYACLTRAGREHEDALDDMMRNIRQYCRYFNRHGARGIPDWLLNDPAYRIAVLRNGPDAFDGILRRLREDFCGPSPNKRK